MVRQGIHADRLVGLTNRQAQVACAVLRQRARFQPFPKVVYFAI
jgi:hypothetical protein